MSHKHEPPQIPNHQLSRLIELAEMHVRLLRILVLEEAPPTLTAIKITFWKGTSMPIGPVTLTTLGQQVTASVVGFDQFGQPWTGEMPASTLASDDTAQTFVTFDPATGLTTAVSNGIVNITGSLTTVEGVALSDTETITVAIPVVPPPTPVLSSIKVNFA